MLIVAFVKSRCAATRPSLPEVFGPGAIQKQQHQRQQRRSGYPPSVSPSDPCVSRGTLPPPAGPSHRARGAARDLQARNHARATPGRVPFYAGCAVVVPAAAAPTRHGPCPNGRPLSPSGTSASARRSCSGRAVAGELGAPVADARRRRSPPRPRAFVVVFLVGTQQPDSFRTYGR